MQKYVLIYCSRKSLSGETEVLLILKDRPAWQANWLNLPGGKIEDGETVSEAAARELLEETGLSTYAIWDIGTIEVGEHHISVVRAFIPYEHLALQPREGETEKPMWMSIRDAKLDRRLIPNLKVVMPLAECVVMGWTIYEVSETPSDPDYSLSIRLSSS